MVAHASGGVETCDLVVVGAGPAGMAAAIEAASIGLSVVVLDEGRAAGGQIHRGAIDGPFAGQRDLGAEHAAGAALVARFAASGARHLAGAAVFLVERSDDGSGKGFLVAASLGPGRSRQWRAAALIVAAGALERPWPLPGWTLPGVMTAGAAQTLLKASALAPEGPVVLAGSGPLLLLLAAQYARLGVKVAALLDTTPAGHLRTALPALPGFLASGYAAKGLSLLREAARSTPIIRGVTEVAAHGEAALERVSFRAGGRDRSLPARILLLHQGVVPQVNLALAIGAAHAWSEGRLAFEPVLGPLGASSVPGLFIAGDAGGVAGAGAAEAGGAMAAIGAALHLGRIDAAGADARAASAARALGLARRGRRFLDALYRPAATVSLPADDVVVCRCEEVTAGEIRDAVAKGARGPNQAKAFTRAGMGPCQARLCGLTVTAIIAAETGLTPGEVGHVRPRMPVKPVTLAEIAALGD